MSCIIWNAPVNVLLVGAPPSWLLLLDELNGRRQFRHVQLDRTAGSDNDDGLSNDMACVAVLWTEDYVDTIFICSNAPYSKQLSTFMDQVMHA